MNARLSIWILAGCLFLAGSCGGSDGDEHQAADTRLDLSGSETGDGGDVRAAARPWDWCLPDQAPDQECFASRRAPDSENIRIASEIAARQIAAVPPESLEWNWEEAVLMWGFLELHKVTADPALTAYASAWVDHHIAAGYVMESTDTCSPAAIAAVLYGLTGEERYREVMEDGLNYLENVALRSPEGGISHLGTLPVVTLWVDSLFMFGNILLARGELAQGQGSISLLGEQLRVFTDALQDDSGLFGHAVGWVVVPQAPVHWGRGNGWVVAAMYQYLAFLRNQGLEDPRVEAAAARLSAAVLGVQDSETGLWWTIVDMPGQAYLETSAAALFAFGMARGFRYGYLDEEVLGPLARAVAGIRARIISGPDGPVVTGVSGPTVADNYQEYLKVSLVDDISFGIGAVILALVETSGLPGVE